MSNGEYLLDMIQSLAQRPAAADAVLPDGASRTALDFALAHCFERASVVPEKTLLAHALMQGVGSATVADVRREAGNAALIRRQAGGEVLTTTRQVHGEEVAIVTYAREGRGKCRALGGGARLADASLSDEQTRAAEQVLASRDRVTALRGR